MVNFYEIANELRLASNQVEAIRALLCIKKDTCVAHDTLKVFAADLPMSFRNWIYDNPRDVFFPCYSREVHDNEFDTEILNYD